MQELVFQITSTNEMLNILDRYPDSNFSLRDNYDDSETYLLVIYLE
jgi:hypothetical protein